MKDLMRLVNECMAELDALSVPYSKNIVEWSINTRAKKRWGQCRKKGSEYRINISSRILADEIADEKTKNTIMHELLHTCPKCMNHGEEWQKWCDLVNDCYAFYKLERTTSSAFFGLEPMPIEDYKYVLKCANCGCLYKRNRASKFTSNPIRYGCGRCGVFGKISLVSAR